MPQKFSFDGAIGSPFRTAHFGSFPWMFALVYALLGSAIVLGIMLLARGAIAEMIASFEALDQTSPDDSEVPGLIFSAMSPLVPFVILGMLVSWVFWSVFQAASMRRYIRDEAFSIRFGSDEINTMVVAVLWWLLAAAFYAIPLMIMFGAFGAAIRDDFSSGSEEVMVGAVFGALGVMLLLFPIYVFFATRLSPAFGLTIKDRKIRFFDAWNVSRGRFWPILGAFVIISIIGSIAASVVGQIVQMVFMMTLVPAMENMNEPQDFVAFMGSGGFLFGVGLYLFATMFVGALQLHFNHGPAAFAARHDPRGGVDDVERLDALN